jgi:nucleoside-diphosphate-sugar epimerase
LKVCVVGGNGNIGYSVAYHLLKRGHQVTCFNRGLTGGVPAGAAVILGNRHEREGFERIIQKENFDAAIDMFCFSRDDAASSIRAFREVGHFICCSSVATYGREFDSFPTLEDHPLRPWTDHNRDYAIGKAEADEEFLAAFRSRRFPVTLIKPSITYGPKMGLLRQIGNDLEWIDRIRKGLPIVVSGDGTSFHQFMHVEDAGAAFALLIGRSECIGESYNLVPDYPTSWETYHKSVMRVVGRDVEMVGVPAETLLKLMSKNQIQLSDVFWRNSYFSGKKLKSAIPEFRPTISLEAGIENVLTILDRERRIPCARSSGWEDQLIEAQRKVSPVPRKKTWLNRLGF